MEQTAFRERAGFEVESLQSARSRLNAPAWKGPVYDPEAPGATEKPLESPED